ncbi:hypothetical protein GGX14DRAFT_652221 [Mycena pura]|uniref:Zn(2)-C6 fungal-type domain-containing protein n=1 Tax=Mycena pura TaxID=153505 RepID=A0AAD6V5B1_9AGAR|nr:hypothetical protein GGX14DRAFT_652221 [Mycena pura]
MQKSPVPNPTHDRAHMACVTCRKHHIKCVPVSPNARTKPCARCTRKGLFCEYLETVEEEMRSAAAGRPASSHSQALAHQNSPGLSPLASPPPRPRRPTGLPQYPAYDQESSRPHAQAPTSAAAYMPVGSGGFYPDHGLGIRQQYQGVAAPVPVRAPSYYTPADVSGGANVHHQNPPLSYANQPMSMHYDHMPSGQYAWPQVSNQANYN